MVMRVEKTGEGYHVVLTDEAMRALRLVDGSRVEVEALAGFALPGITIGEPISAEEATASYLRTEPAHINTYRELAK